jgi:hypothetical protein
MADTVRTIHVPPESELARLLDEARDAPLRLEKDGVTYRLSREEDDIWATYDPEAVHEALRTAAGTLTPEEGEELKAYIYRGREEGSRPADRP